MKKRQVKAGLYYRQQQVQYATTQTGLYSGEFYFPYILFTPSQCGMEAGSSIFGFWGSYLLPVHKVLKFNITGCILDIDSKKRSPMELKHRRPVGKGPIYRL